MGGDAKKKQGGEENREPIHETEETTRSRSETRFGLGSDELERTLLTGESRGLLEDNYRILADRPVTYQAGHFFVRHTIAFIEVTGLGKVRVDPYYIGECEGGDYK